MSNSQQTLTSNGVTADPDDYGTVPWDPDMITLSDLRGRVVYRPKPPTEPIDLRAIPLPLPVGDVALGELVLDLTARHPYEDTGWVDFYEPGRWDCTSDTIYMSTIQMSQPGSLGPSWTGTVGYANFIAPADNLYVVVVNFSGSSTSQSMDLMGPWGKTTTFLPWTGLDQYGHYLPKTAAATAVWDANAGDKFGGSFLAHTGSTTNVILPGYADLAIPLVFFHSFQVYTAA
jgi:hypothetical protein